VLFRSRINPLFLFAHGSLHDVSHVLEEVYPGLMKFVCPAVLQRRLNGLYELWPDQLKQREKSALRYSCHV
jgi:hypothetical protein